MKELIERYKALQAEVSKLQSELYKTSDGYNYITELNSYGSKTFRHFKNEYTTQLLCDEYYFGDDGFISVYTDNPNHSINAYNGVTVLTTEDLNNKFSSMMKVRQPK